jgi:hypothetical protein
VPEPRQIAEQLTPAEAFILLEIAFDELALWEMSFMSVVEHGRETRTVGPGALVTNPEERLRLAKEGALGLLRKGLLEMRKGPDLSEEGDRVSLEEAEEALAENANWAWPTHCKRDTFFWFVATPAGEGAASLISPQDIPSVRGEVHTRRNLQLALRHWLSRLTSGRSVL